MKFVVEVQLHHDDEQQGDTVAAWLDLIADGVRRKRRFQPFDRKIEGESIWKVIP